MVERPGLSFSILLYIDSHDALIHHDYFFKLLLSPLHAIHHSEFLHHGVE